VALANVYRLRALARRAGASAESLLHCRGPVPALVAWTLPGRWVFDFRGYVVDERLEAGRWFGNPLVLRLARSVERRLFRSSSAAVSLTELAAEDVRSGRFGDWPADKPLIVVPTCADYDEFSIPRREGEIPAEVRSRLEGRCVLAFVGSVNASYRTVEALRLFRRVLEHRRDVHLLCLTRQREELLRLLEREGVPEDVRTLATATPDAMPRWLSHIDWGLHLLEPSPAKRASMPTKLAEFFAAGVRPIHYGCNAEVGAWVERAGSGVVLDGIGADDLDRAARRVAEAPVRPDILRQARERTRSHFDLEAGARRYEGLLRELLSGIRVSSPDTPEAH
jgi:glycosyltransferase involved in cell wall biosynthesis